MKRPGRWFEFFMEFVVPGVVMTVWSWVMFTRYGWPAVFAVWATLIVGQGVAFSRLRRRMYRELDETHRMFQNAFSVASSKLEEARIRSLERAPPSSKRLWGAGSRDH